jgi:hypothetical protein
MWLGSETTSEDFANLMDFFVWNGGGGSAKSYEVNNSRDLLDAQPIADRQVDEDVAGEERKLEANRAILPSAGGLVLREEILDAAIRELMSDGTLVISAGVNSEPLGLNMAHKSLRAENGRFNRFGRSCL